MPSRIRYRDELPKGCPGDLDPTVIEEALVAYHAVSVPVDWSREFRSFAKTLTERHGGDYKAESPVKDCISHGLSVHLTLKAAEDNLKLWQKRNPKKWAGKRICKVELNAGAGAILRTDGGRPVERGDHYTWWPAHGFDLQAHTDVP